MHTFLFDALISYVDRIVCTHSIYHSKYNCTHYLFLTYFIHTPKFLLYGQAAKQERKYEMMSFMGPQGSYELPVPVDKDRAVNL